MNKRGEFLSAPIFSVLALITIILGISLFSSAYNKITDSSCKTGLIELKSDLETSYKSVGRLESKEFVESLPCKADKIFFFDKNSFTSDFIDDNAGLLDDSPLIKDSLSDGDLETNVFLVKGDEIIESFPIGDINIEYPYYSCLVSKQGQINYFLEKKGLDTNLYSGCNQPECSYIPINPPKSLADALKMVVESKEAKDEETGGACSSCTDVSNPMEELMKFDKTYDNVKLSKKYEVCRNGGSGNGGADDNGGSEKTTVEILITPKDGVKIETFRFYESLPKDICIENLKDAIKFIESDSGNGNNAEIKLSVKDDPLIVWQFDDVEGTQSLKYEINKILGEECRAEIDSLAIAEVIKNIESGGEIGVDTPLPEIKDKIDEEIGSSNGRPVLSFDSRYELSIDNVDPTDDTKTITINLDDAIVYDDFTATNELIFEIEDQSDTNAVNCDLDHTTLPKTITCNAFSKGTSLIRVKAEDGQGEVGSDSFNVVVNGGEVDEDEEEDDELVPIVIEEPVEINADEDLVINLMDLGSDLLGSIPVNKINLLNNPDDPDDPDNQGIIGVEVVAESDGKDIGGCSASGFDITCIINEDIIIDNTITVTTKIDIQEDPVLIVEFKVVIVGGEEDSLTFDLPDDDIEITESGNRDVIDLELFTSDSNGNDIEFIFVSATNQFVSSFTPTDNGKKIKSDNEIACSIEGNKKIKCERLKEPDSTKVLLNVKVQAYDKEENKEISSDNFRVVVNPVDNEDEEDGNGEVTLNVNAEITKDKYRGKKIDGQDVNKFYWDYVVNIGLDKSAPFGITLTKYELCDYFSKDNGNNYDPINEEKPCQEASIKRLKELFNEELLILPDFSKSLSNSRGFDSLFGTTYKIEGIYHGFYNNNGEKINIQKSFIIDNLKI